MTGKAGSPPPPPPPKSAAPAKAPPPPPKAPAAIKPPAAAEAPVVDVDAVKKECLDVVQALFNNFEKSIVTAVETLTARQDTMELHQIGLNNAFTSFAPDGHYALNLDEADEETLRRWNFRLAGGDFHADPEEIRKALKAKEGKKDFEGWTVVNEEPFPGQGGAYAPAPEAEAEVEAEAEAAESDSQELTADMIAGAGFKELLAFADDIGVETADLRGKKGKPSRESTDELRNRLLAAIAEEGGNAEEGEPTEDAAEEGGEEDSEEGDAAEEGGEEAPSFEIGETLLYTDPESKEVQECVYRGTSTEYENAANVTFGKAKQKYPVAFDSLSRPESE